MNLPDNIQEALERGRLTRQHPIKYQIFQILPLGKKNQQTLIQLSDEPYDSESDAQLDIARVIERSRVKRKQFTILPVIIA